MSDTQGTEMQEKLLAGLRLLGNMVRHPSWKPGDSARCLMLCSDGRVVLDIGGMHRVFDPEDLELEGDRVAVPLVGKVD